MAKKSENKKSENKKSENKTTKPKGEDKAKPQDLMMRYSFFKSQLEEAIGELKKLELVKSEQLTTKTTLANMKDLENGNECIMPLGADVFLFSKLSDKQDVLVSLGSNVVMKKSVPDAISKIDSNIGELEAREKELTNNIQFAQSELEKITPQIQALQESSKK